MGGGKLPNIIPGNFDGPTQITPSGNASGRSFAEPQTEEEVKNNAIGSFAGSLADGSESMNPRVFSSSSGQRQVASALEMLENFRRETEETIARIDQFNIDEAKRRHEQAERDAQNARFDTRSTPIISERDRIRNEREVYMRERQTPEEKRLQAILSQRRLDDVKDDEISFFDDDIFE